LSSSEIDDQAYMRAAMSEAQLAADRGEVPVGSVAVFEGRIIARAYNLRETARDPSAHAELTATRAAAAYLGRWRLSGVTIFVTLEPCVMCAGGLVNARVDRLVYGAIDPKAGAVQSLYRIAEDVRLNHRMTVSAGILGEECAEQLRTFFATVRAKR
jgi:tRNA(adenine34) deaminase